MWNNQVKKVPQSPETGYQKAYIIITECGTMAVRFVWGEDQVGSIPIIPTITLRRRQAVSHRFLVSVCAGSNPAVSDMYKIRDDVFHKITDDEKAKYLLLGLSNNACCYYRRYCTTITTGLGCGLSDEDISNPREYICDLYKED